VKVRLDTSRCAGHGRCYVLAPELFDSSDEGYGQVGDEDVRPGLEAQARRAEQNCPEQAITLLE
jgi:ferredoxin